MTSNIEGLTTFTTDQLTYLSDRGLTAEDALMAGWLSVTEPAGLPAEAQDYWATAPGYLPGLLIPWRSAVNGDMSYQLHPDGEVFDAKGERKKYIFPDGWKSVLHPMQTAVDPEYVLIIEGTAKMLAAAKHAPDNWAVYGIAGCQNWMRFGVPMADLHVVEDRKVLICLDADASSNWNVYLAGIKLAEAIRLAGAEVALFIRVPGTGKEGIDDVLAGQPQEQRAKYLKRLVRAAIEAPKGEKRELPSKTQPPGPRPRAKMTDLLDEDTTSQFFDDFGGLLVKNLAGDILASAPMAVTMERTIAVYRDGYYQVDPEAFNIEVAARLGNRYRVGHVANVESYAIAGLIEQGKKLPEFLAEPVLNFRNGMLDIRTRKLMPHDPKWMSSWRIDMDWDESAQAPTYEAWLAAQCPGQGDALEEAVSIMLNGAATPTKAVFLYGPSRSGKSTFLRILVAVAGPEGTSGVSLHQLATNRFMAANLYGKVLNVSADLSAGHLEDVSLFKMMLGEDVIQADRKHGSQFAFINRALFAFSANNPPTVGEDSRAYFERTAPFEFPRSFAGAEDPTIEQAMIAELPGILVRWVKAYQRRIARGRVADQDAGVVARFEEASDKVRRFLSNACRVTDVQGTGVDPKEMTSGINLYRGFELWCKAEGVKPMARTRFVQRLESVAGLLQVQSKGSRTRGWNVVVRPEGQWGDMSVSSLDEEVQLEQSEQTSTTVPTFPETDMFMKTYTEPQKAAQYGQSAHSAPIAVSQIDALFTKFGDQTIPVCEECGTTKDLLDSIRWSCPNEPHL